MDDRVAELAGRQFNRISRAQLHVLGMSDESIAHRVAAGRYVIVQSSVIAIAPVLEHDERGRFMEAVLVEPESLLGRTSASAAWGFWGRRRDFETVVRVGSGGPRRTGGVLVTYSTTLDGDRDELRGIPITSVPRTLLDLSVSIDRRQLARALREALRLGLTTKEAVFDRALAARGRRGSRRLLVALARYTDLPVERARSWSELRALELLRDSGRPMAKLNRRIAGEEADLSWPQYRQIVEIDGGQFHLDRGEDARKEACWRSARWTVRRAPADWIHEAPERFLALCPPPNVRNDPA
jgi:very-short-patch-repair endonuclease